MSDFAPYIPIAVAVALVAICGGWLLWMERRADNPAAHRPYGPQDPRSIHPNSGVHCTCYSLACPKCGCNVGVGPRQRKYDSLMNRLRVYCMCGFYWELETNDAARQAPGVLR